MKTGYFSSPVGDTNYKIHKMCECIRCSDEFATPYPACGQRGTSIVSWRGHLTLSKGIEAVTCPGCLAGWNIHLLSNRDKLILCLRGPEKKWTLKAVGQELGLSIERVRQIEIKALKKIREGMDTL